MTDTTQVAGSSVSDDEPASADGAGVEPPDPPGYVAPLVYGRDPPRTGPFDRSAVLVVHDPSGTIRHTVPCDTMQVPELRELLRVLFAGSSPSGSAPALPPDATLLLQIDWLEHGNIIAVSRLYSLAMHGMHGAEGILVRDKNGTLTVDRNLDSDALAAVIAEIDRAGLRDASRTWCTTNPP